MLDFLRITLLSNAQKVSITFNIMPIGIARGGHDKEFALPSLNFALPSSKTFSYFKLYIEVLL